MSGIVRRAPHVLERRFAHEVLLASRDRREVDRLEGTAATVWEVLEEPRLLKHLVDVLATTYGVGERQVESDVRSLLDELEERGYVEVATDA